MFHTAFTLYLVTLGKRICTAAFIERANYFHKKYFSIMLGSYVEPGDYNCVAQLSVLQ